ncbi:MAG: MBOAT family protein [Oscillospiraceae bacterium]|nr:MBOAT family protein [Oscillospiraceae bacterium]
MTFNSIQFLIFFPVVSLLYFLIPHRFRWMLLLAASYYFYMSWNPRLVFLILFTTVVSYTAARIMERCEDKKKKKLCLAVALCACLGVLFFFKYFNFLSSTVTALLRAVSLDVDDFLLDLILPVGISFYTFQTLSYVIDVYRGTIQAEHHFGYYALFVSYFPQLVAGPIERPQNLLPQLKAEHHFERDNFHAGMKTLIAGFFKKVVVADQLATYVVAVYSDPSSATAPAIILATVMFSFQVYCDFSGYTDIAVGCARIMGVKLTQNFDLPYSSRSCHEFWERWHISLTSWFQDYVFYPLAMNKKLTRFARKLGKKLKKPRIGSMLPPCVALFITFLLSGLWHGAAWTYVLWGAIHGLYQVIERITERGRMRLQDKLHINRDSRIFAFWQMAVVFVLCSFALIFFRANSGSDLGILLKNLFTNWTFRGTFGLLGMDWVDVGIAVASLVIMTLIDRIFVHGWPIRQPKGGSLVTAEVSAFLLLAIAASWILLLAGDGASAFIYFQF